MSDLSNEIKKEYVDMLYKCVSLDKTINEIAEEKRKLEMASYILKQNLHEYCNTRNKLNDLQVKHLLKIKANEKNQ